MADDEKARAEKIAAAKKRVEQMKKQKAKKAGAGTATKKDEPAEPGAADQPTVTEEAPNEDVAPLSPIQTTAPSLSQQSKLRSTSFRKASISGPISPGLTSPSHGPLLSPDGETAPDIYRKHVARIEELERENRRLAKEAADAEKRWQKADEELADLREAEGGGRAGGSDSQVQKLKNDLAAAQRQRDQLQAQLSRAGGASARHGSSPSISTGTPPQSELEAQLASRSATIETMELEMSRLRAQVERLSVSAATPGEQLVALEDKLARAERAASLAQRELADVKRNLERADQKAVREGSERASAETKLRALEREAAEAAAARDEAAKKADALEKKAATLTTLHREQDARAQALRRDKERAEREVADLRERLERAEAEGARLRKRDAGDGGGQDIDDGVAELEGEERARLERRLRALEAENTDLRRGIWRDQRRDMQPDLADEHASPGGAGARFTEVDLGGAGGPLHSPSHRKAAGGGLGDFFTSGLNALTGAAPAAHEHEGFLEDDDLDFDEEAFRRAQEEEAKKRIERIKEIKRGLKNWETWRLDLVESRRGGGEGVGEIFEI